MKGPIYKVDKDEEIVQLMIRHQGHLYAYILTLLPDSDAARDVLQETNLVLWRKAEQFQAGTNFFAWACRTAGFQTMAWLRDRKRDRLKFNEEFLETLSGEASAIVPEITDRLASLRNCMRRLSDRDQLLLQRRYTQSVTVTHMAEEAGKTVNAISRSLYRVRRLLLTCMDRVASA